MNPACRRWLMGGMLLARVGRAALILATGAARPHRAPGPGSAAPARAVSAPETCLKGGRIIGPMSVRFPRNIPEEHEILRMPAGFDRGLLPRVGGCVFAAWAHLSKLREPSQRPLGIVAGRPRVVLVHLAGRETPVQTRTARRRTAPGDATGKSAGALPVNP